MSKTTLKTLMRAIKTRNIEKLKEILDKNPEYLLLHNEDWETPFHISVSAKKSEPEILKLCIELSLQNKYNVRELLNKQDMNGFTPLHVVCRLIEEPKHRQIFDKNVKCLIDNGIDIYIKCENLRYDGVFIISSIISMYLSLIHISEPTRPY